MDDAKMQDTILRTLYSNQGREAVLVPSMFNPPIMLSNLFRIGGMLKAKGFTTPPTRRMGGWHLRLLEAGIAYCEADSQGNGPGPVRKI